MGVSFTQRWWDVENSLRRGLLTEAIAVLEAEGDEDAEGTDWASVHVEMWEEQPDLARRVKDSLKRPASRGDLIQLLGSLMEPFTLVKTDLNTLVYYSQTGQTGSTPNWAELKRVYCKFY